MGRKTCMRTVPAHYTELNYWWSTHALIWWWVVSCRRRAGTRWPSTSSPWTRARPRPPSGTGARSRCGRPPAAGGCSCCRRRRPARSRRPPPPGRGTPWTPASGSAARSCPPAGTRSCRCRRWAPTAPRAGARRPQPMRRLLPAHQRRGPGRERGKRGQALLQETSWLAMI